jgi:hypothetical protein
VIVLFHKRGPYQLSHERQPECPREQKGQPGTNTETNCGINCSYYGAIEIAANESGNFCRNCSCDQYLENLNNNENKIVVRMKGFDENDQFLIVIYKVIVILVVKV